MKFRIIGCILLILGTAIGAGMLALPVSSSNNNFLTIVIMLIAAWIVMTIGAFALLEVNLNLKPGNNILTMAKRTLGWPGRLITAFVYLALMYSALCAYISANSDLLQAVMQSSHMPIPRALATILSTALLGIIAGRGIATIDTVNRLLMSTKLISFAILVGVLVHYSNPSLLKVGNYQWQTNNFLVMISAFGFATIIPSISSYLNNDKALLRKIVFIGSVIPLFLYIAWTGAVRGVVPVNGAYGFADIATSEHTNSMLIHAITYFTQMGFLSIFPQVFISICALTSFLGISLCIIDFFADGFSIDKKGWSLLLLLVLTYAPPTIVVLIAPGIFVTALSYAGILCAALFVIIPVAMLISLKFLRKK